MTSHVEHIGRVTPLRSQELPKGTAKKGVPAQELPPSTAQMAGSGWDPTAPLPVLSQLTRAGLVLWLAGASVTLATLYILTGGPTDRLFQRAFSRGGGEIFVVITLCGGLVSSLAPLSYALWRGTRTAADHVTRLARVLSPAMLAAVVPLLFDWKVFRGEELLGVVVIALFGLGLERAFRTSFQSVPWGGIRTGLLRLRLAFPVAAKWLPALIVAILVVSFAVYFSYHSIRSHNRLGSQAFDLAIFDNLMWNLMRGEWFKAAPVLGPSGSHIQYHATFIAYLLIPFYALRQSAETLLVLQAIICGAGAIPLYLIVKRRLGSPWMGVLFAYAYVVYAPLHGPIFYDFHFLTLAPFWIGWVLYFFETGRRGWLIVAWILALLLREEQGAVLSMACFFYLVSGQRVRWAIAGGILSAAYFLAIKFAVMPAHASAGRYDTYAGIFGGLVPPGERGYAGVLRTVFSNPLFTLNTLLVPAKVIYALKLLSPVLLLPLRNSRAWLLLVFPAMVTLLTTNYNPTVQISFQYTANWTAFVFFATAVTLASWRDLKQGRTRIAAAVAALAVVSTAISYNYGAIFQHNNFQGGFRRVHFEHSAEDLKNVQDLYGLIAMIPSYASVSATEMEAPHLSNRANCFTIRVGTYDADYLLVSLEEARQGGSHENMKRALATGKYGFIDSRGRFALWGKGAPTDRNVQGALLLGVEGTLKFPTHNWLRRQKKK